MDPILNPYAPGTGSPPPELAGRDDIREKARIATERIRLGRPAKSILIIGLRGVGKTCCSIKSAPMLNPADFTPYASKHPKGGRSRP